MYMYIYAYIYLYIARARTQTPSAEESRVDLQHLITLRECMCVCG